MTRWFLVVWTCFAAVASFAVGIWAAIVPYGSIWVGTLLALVGIGLVLGIGLYVRGEASSRSPERSVPRMSAPRTRQPRVRAQPLPAAA